MWITYSHYEHGGGKYPEKNLTTEGEIDMIYKESL